MKCKIKNKFLYILTALLLGSAVLMGCSEEEKRGAGAPFFKISVSEESFGNTGLTRAAADIQSDTIITQIDDDLYMETVLSNDNVQTTETRASSTSPQADVLSGTKVTILAYSGNTYVGQINGTVGANGNVTITDNQLSLEEGTYTFVCLANVDIDSGHTFFYAKKGSNSMSAKVTKEIQATDQGCELSFTMQHRVGQVRVTVTSEIGNFTGLSATLSTKASGCPYKQKIDLPSTADNTHYELQAMSDQCFSNVNGMQATSKDENYYIGGYDYTYWGNISLNFTSGTIGGQSIAGKSISFNSFDIQQNQISKADVTFKKKSEVYTVSFTATAGGTISNMGGSGQNGTEITSTAIPDAGHIFGGWYDGETKISDNTTLAVTFSSVTNGKSYQAKFRKERVKILFRGYSSTVYSSINPANSTLGELLNSSELKKQVPINYDITYTSSFSGYPINKLREYDIVMINYPYNLVSASDATLLYTWLVTDGNTNRVLWLIDNVAKYGEKLLTKFGLTSTSAPTQIGSCYGTINSKVPGAYNIAADAILKEKGIVGLGNPIIKGNPSWTMNGSDMRCYIADSDDYAFRKEASSTFTPIFYAPNSTSNILLGIDFEKRFVVTYATELTSQDAIAEGEACGFARAVGNNITYGSNPTNTNCRAYYLYTPLFANPADAKNWTTSIPSFTYQADCTQDLIKAYRSGRIMWAGIMGWMLNTAATK